MAAYLKRYTWKKHNEEPGLKKYNKAIINKPFSACTPSKSNTFPIHKCPVIQIVAYFSYNEAAIVYYLLITYALAERYNFCSLLYTFKYKV